MARNLREIFIDPHAPQKDDVFSNPFGAQMPKPDLPNFSLPMRILVGVIALWLVYWLLKTTGTI